MKKLLVIVLMLIGMMGQAQNMRLVNFSTTGNPIYNESGQYFYLDGKLDSAVIHGIEITRDTIWTKLISYHEDTLMYMLEHPRYFYYSYTEDSVVITHVEYNDTVAKQVYYINENHQVYLHNGRIYEWEDNNMIKSYYEDNIFLAEYAEYVNPHLLVNKYFHFNYFGSYHHPRFIWEYDHMFDYRVIHSDGDYPTEVEVYVTDGEVELYEQTYHYEYEDVTVISASPYVPRRVLQISYYDLMGREIEKPMCGFYIERKVTDKGIISIKHYIQ